MKNKNFVFDTNSLISALLIPSSISRQALKKAQQGGQLVFSEETLIELNEVLIRSKFDKYIPLHERIEFSDRLEAEGRVIKIKSNFTDCRDIKDNKFLNLAFDGNAEYIITGDNDLLILNPFRTIKILSPSAFVNEFKIEA